MHECGLGLLFGSPLGLRLRREVCFLIHCKTHRPVFHPGLASHFHHVILVFLLCRLLPLRMLLQLRRKLTVHSYELAALFRGVIWLRLHGGIELLCICRTCNTLHTPPPPHEFACSRHAVLQEHQTGFRPLALPVLAHPTCRRFYRVQDVQGYAWCGVWVSELGVRGLGLYIG